ncbi:MAG: cation transporter [Oscillospiraceae bacterium]|jgi:copper chaperone|nr:cation transporter [Oscillospiraceae bacterium]
MQTINVANMSCEHCKGAVEAALTGLGLKKVTVDLAAKTAEYEENPDIGMDDIRAAIEEEGFEVIL